MGQHQWNPSSPSQSLRERSLLNQKLADFVSNEGQPASKTAILSFLQKNEPLIRKDVNLKGSETNPPLMADFPAMKKRIQRNIASRRPKNA